MILLHYFYIHFVNEKIISIVVLLLFQHFFIQDEIGGIDAIAGDMLLRRWGDTLNPRRQQAKTGGHSNWRVTFNSNSFRIN